MTTMTHLCFNGKDRECRPYYVRAFATFGSFWMIGSLATLSGSHQGLLILNLYAKTFTSPDHTNVEFELGTMQIQTGVTMTPEHLCSRRHIGVKSALLIKSC